MRFTVGLTLVVMSLVATANARAESDGRPTVIVGIQPADGQVDVPIDVVPRVFTQLSEDGGDDFYSPQLSLLRGYEEVESTQRKLVGVYPETTELSPDAVLEPNTTYTFLIAGQENWDGPVSRSVTFTTGTEKATPIAAAPQFELLSAQFDVHTMLRSGEQVYHEVAFRFDPATLDPHRLSMVRISDGEFVWGTFIPGGEPLEAMTYFYQVPGEEICFTAVQVNASGDEKSSERACIDSTMATSGCQAGYSPSAPTAPALAAAALMIVVLRRRKIVAGR